MNATAQVPFCLTVLVDNTSPSADRLAEHGLALLLETDRGVVLFDTGASTRALTANAARLGVSLSGATSVVLSHGHYDHSGGRPAVLKAAPEASVYVHGPTSARRWIRRIGWRREIGMPAVSRAALGRRHHVSVGKPQALPEGLRLSGPIPGPAGHVRGRDVRPGSHGLRMGPGDRVLSPRRREHPRPRHDADGRRPVRAILGGLHLEDFRPRDLKPVLAALRGAGVRPVLCGHCTGEAAQEYLTSHLESRVQPIHIGLRPEAQGTRTRGKERSC